MEFVKPEVILLVDRCNLVSYSLIDFSSQHLRSGLIVLAPLPERNGYIVISGLCKLPQVGDCCIFLSYIKIDGSTLR